MTDEVQTALEDFVRWADEWICEKDRREAHKITPGMNPAASFAERALLLNSQLVYLRDQGRAALKDETP